MRYLSKSPVIPTRTAALVAAVALITAVAVLGMVAPGAYAQSFFSITQSQDNTAFGSSTFGGNSIEQEIRQNAAVTIGDVSVVASQIGTTSLRY